jgi:hypothetical protein
MKTTTITRKLMSGAFALMSVVSMSSCQGLVDAVLGHEDNASSGTTTPTTVPGIPSDASAKPNPTLPGSPNTTIPNPGSEVVTKSGQTVVNFNLTGILDPTQAGGWLKLYGTGSNIQNVWMSIDGNAKGIAVINTIDQSTVTSAVDLVFLVDNSGSMSEEANAVADGIIDWSKKLSNTLDMRFGCVGYWGPITGGINMTTIDKFVDFLNYNNSKGTSRTTHFAEDGTDWSTLKPAYSPTSSMDENGVAALRLADENFKFRSGANRVYVNFTDEPIYPQGEAKWSTDYVKEPANWPTTKGTIHTVFSDEYYKNWSDDRWTPLYEEKPWLLSEYTGGTTKFAPSDFSGVTLDDLPITGALMNSYVISVTNVTSLFDGKEHIVKITILNADGSIRAEKEFTMIFKK